ncbi:MAG: hypothetical protein SGI74_03340 [Oligoflexia bacterium]|nr:hypothetical protein [Oligoflexia bacterium]
MSEKSEQIKKSKKTREAKPGELRAIKILETIEKFSKRPEARMDLQRLLDRLSPDGKIYARHLIMSGPSGNAATVTATGLTIKQIEDAMLEIEDGLSITT